MVDVKTRKQTLAVTLEKLREEKKDVVFTYPSLVKMASNLLHSVEDAIQEIRDSGDIVVEDEEYLDRMETCVTCDLLDPGPVRCTHQDCGCFLEAKARGAAMYCPLMLWPGDAEKAAAGLLDMED